MTGTASDPRPDQRGDVRGALPVDEEAYVLLGRKPRHDPQAVAQRGVEQRAWRRRVGDPDGVDSDGRHPSEVAFDLPEIVILVPFLVRTEGAVRDTPHVELLAAHKEELARHARPLFMSTRTRADPARNDDDLPPWGVRWFNRSFQAFRRDRQHTARWGREGES